jgi:signal transduction histidine kinase
MNALPQAGHLPKILIVEDERVTAQHIRLSLNRLGYEVVGIVATGKAAIQRAEETKPNLLLADIGLRGAMDGIEVAAQVRARWGIPTVFLTAYGDEETVRRARATEPFGYLVKPFAEQELHATIEIALHQQSLSDQHKQLTAKREQLLDRTKEELSALASRLFSAQEEERKRIARDLHDDIVQRLAWLQIEVESLQQHGLESCSKEIIRQVKSLGPVLARLSDDLRDLSHRLHPSTLDHLGLQVALSQLIEDFRKRTSIPIRFSHRGVTTATTGETALSLYRVAQEALTNITRHAGAASVTVALVTAPDSINLSIRDTGNGFNLETARGSGGLGLISMDERVSLLGGTFTIHSEVGKGTQVQAHVPIRDKSRAPLSAEPDGSGQPGGMASGR